MRGSGSSIARDEKRRRLLEGAQLDLGDEISCLSAMCEHFTDTRSADTLSIPQDRVYTILFPATQRVIKSFERINDAADRECNE